ncbi:uncharacterized protein UTRI_10202 [Ustilago trichophora]|uniref:Uncharacterized protein n=1 Tax=Ustilago trichophora TaxID=86804 RepID=A0A5C3EF63_9BASI|nr:uncharacterized protein UTRI_10202 [Ustilago trichophora]
MSKSNTDCNFGTLLQALLYRSGYVELTLSLIPPDIDDNGGNNGGKQIDSKETGDNSSNVTINDRAHPKIVVNKAESLISWIVIALNDIKPGNRCSHPSLDAITGKPFPASSISPCSAHLIWKNGRRQQCSSATTLLDSIKSESITLKGIVDALPSSPPPSDLVIATEIWLQLLPLLFTTDKPPPVVHDANTDLQVRRDFSSPLHGDAVFDLQRYTLSTNSFIGNRRDFVYAKTFAILQSSGTGKTKLAVQLSAFQAGLLICTRSPKHLDGHTSTSFPPNDDEVYQFLRQAQPTVSLFEAHRRIASWLAAYFEQLYLQLQQRMHRSGCFHPDLSPRHANVAACWSTIVYDLAIAIHSGPDFIENYTFFDPRRPSNANNHERFCQESTLMPSEKAKGSSPPPRLSRSRNFRTHFLHQVSEQAGKKYAPRSKHKLSPEPKPEPEPKPKLKPKPKPKHDPEPDPELQAKMAADEFMAAPLQQLEALLPSDLHASHYFFLAVDEVATLGDLLPIFRRLWRESKPRCTWLMFIDTDSNVALLAGQEVIEASARLGIVGGLIVVDPFTFLPFDVTLQHEGLNRLDDLLASRLTFGHLLETLRYFGRPLWSTGLYLDAEGDQKWPKIPNLLRKLLVHADRTSPWPKKKGLHRVDTIMAATAQRLPLTFVGIRGARQQSCSTVAKTTPPQAVSEAESTSSNSSSLDQHGSAADDDQPHSGVEALPADDMFTRQIHFLQAQVSHHLRVISEVHGTSYFVTTTVSEPPLSLAVAFLLRGKGDEAMKQCSERWSDIVDILSKAYQTVGLLLGEEGEECVRLLCSLASDLAAAGRVAQLGDQASQSDLDALRAQCDPVCLADWLKQLLKVENLSGELLSWASSYYLNFTHYLELQHWVHPGLMDPLLLVEAWWRQVAIYGNTTQPGWDLLIPIYHSEQPPQLSDSFEPSRLSYVALQVKNSTTSIIATKKFGPSHCSHLAAAKGVAAPRFTIHNECLEMFIDLRSPVVTPHAYQKTYRDSTEKPSICRNVVVSGWSSQVFGALEELTEVARKQMWRLFDLSESSTIDSTRLLRSVNSTPGIDDVRRFYKYGGGLHTCYSKAGDDRERTSITGAARSPKQTPKQVADKLVAKQRSSKGKGKGRALEQPGEPSGSTNAEDDVEMADA